MAISAGGSHSPSTRLLSSSSAPMSLTDLGHREPAGEPRRRPSASLAEVDLSSLGGCYRLSRRPGGTPVRHAASATGWYLSVRRVVPAARWLRSGPSSIAGLPLSMQNSAAIRALVALVGLAAVSSSSGSRTLGAAVPLPSITRGTEPDRRSASGTEEPPVGLLRSSLSHGAGPVYLRAGRTTPEPAFGGDDADGPGPCSSAVARANSHLCAVSHSHLQAACWNRMRAACASRCMPRASKYGTSIAASSPW